MSGIEALESISEYAPNRYEEKREKIEPAKEMPNEQIQASKVQASVEQQDQKTTVQGFQYTGKGSFIDKIF